MLAYRFTAVYEDGTEYQQNEHDVSVTDPGRSCYFDIEQDRLVYFVLEDGAGHRYGVDLSNGNFAVDGVPFRMHEGPVADVRLIFFRRHTHQFNLGYDEIDHTVVYRLGWQGTDAEGNNVQRVMELD